jgi:hypothetical protein
MRTQFEMEKDLKNEFLEFAKNKIPVNYLKPERFINKKYML